MNNDEKTIVSKSARLAAVYNSPSWVFKNILFSCVWLYFNYLINSGYYPESALASAVALVAILLLISTMGAITTKSWSVFFAGMLALLSPAMIVGVYIFIGGITVHDQYHGAKIMAQYAQELTDDDCSFTKCPQFNATGSVSVNALKTIVAKQDKIAEAITKMASTQTVLNEINALEVVPSESVKTVNAKISELEDEAKAHQLKNLSLMREFVNYSIYVCKDANSYAPASKGYTLAGLRLANTSSAPTPDLVCTIQDMRDYGKTLPALFPHWTWLLEHFGYLPLHKSN